MALMSMGGCWESFGVSVLVGRGMINVCDGLKERNEMKENETGLHGVEGAHVS